MQCTQEPCQHSIIGVSPAVGGKGGGVDCVIVHSGLRVGGTVQRSLGLWADPKATKIVVGPRDVECSCFPVELTQRQG